MKLSYRWLNDYLPTQLTAPEAAALLTTSGLEVEGIETHESIRGGLRGLVVGEVLTCTDHPDSDHLHVTTVSTGGGEPLQVVCGATNVAAGQKVVLATVGATLYPIGAEEGFTIKKSKIRGVESFGMICAEDEIGIGTGHDGILVLPADTPAGTPVAELFQLGDDQTLEIGLTPNRIDAASHYGVARDLAAILTLQGTPCKAQLPAVELPAAANPQPVEVVVEAPDAAPRYMGLTMSGIRIAPSPEWLQQRLRAIGLNPRNNVVDITNHVMYECGQPLHAFDLSRVEGRKIVVKRCAEGTPFTTLDGVERTLSADDLMICSATRPMCLAGVFGGLDSGVSDTTTEIFLESAYFNPVSVRKSAKRHGLSTDSSFRFERGTDPDMPPYALRRAAALIAELASGKVTSPVVDHYPAPVEPFRFGIEYGRINDLIGKEIPVETVKTILASLEIAIEKETPSGLQIGVPAYRVDIRREVDVIEEILRIYGFNNVENPHYIKNVITVGNQQTADRMIDTLSNLLVSCGATEIMSNSLTRLSYYDGLEQLPAARCVRILNPLSNELNAMRQTLLFNALEAIQLNSNRKRSDLKFFEFGHCYFFDPDKATDETRGTLKPYREGMRLGIALTGLATQPNWNQKAVPGDLFTLKALAERMLQRLGVSLHEGSYSAGTNDLYADSMQYTLRGKPLFEMGVVARKIAAQFDLKAPVYFLELDVDQLARVAATVKVAAAELSKFPEVSRDLALLVDKSVTFEALHAAGMKSGKKLLKSISLFDVYEGDKLPEGKKSYALNFVLEDTAKTLTDGEIDHVMGNLIAAFEKLGAQVRS